MAKKTLTRKKTDWVNQFKPQAVKGNPLNYNAAVSARYEKALVTLTRQMMEDVESQIKKAFEGETSEAFFSEDASVSSQLRILTNRLYRKWTKIFTDKAIKLAERMVNDQDAASKSSVYSSLKELSGGLSLKTNIYTGPMREVLKASVNTNVDLIKSIASGYLNGVKAEVQRSISTGNGLADLVPYFEKHHGMERRKAKNLAEDQTRKVYNSVNKSRMQAIGLKKFEWLHSGGGQNPRPDHVAMSGKVYSFDDLPVIDQRTGERGIPGQAPNCRCRMRPVIEFEDDEE